MSALTNPVASSTVATLHARYLALLPRIETHARICFRDVRCPDKREDCIAEVIGLTWKWFLVLAQKGKDATEFATVLASFAVRAVRSGRKVMGQERARDVMSLTAQKRHGFRVQSLPTSTRVPFEELYSTPRGQHNLDVMEERLADNTRTPPDEQAAFRVDFRAWRLSYTDRDRRLIDDLMVGERTSDVSQKYGLSSSRVSQKRREFMEDWEYYCGDRPPSEKENGGRQTCSTR